MRPNKTRREWLTAEEVAAMYGVSAPTIRRLAAAGEIPATRIGRQWRFDPSVVYKTEKKGA